MEELHVPTEPKTEETVGVNLSVPTPGTCSTSGDSAKSDISGIIAVDEKMMNLKVADDAQKQVLAPSKSNNKKGNDDTPQDPQACGLNGIDMSTQPMPAPTPNEPSRPGAFAAGGRPVLAPDLAQDALPTAAEDAASNNDRSPQVQEQQQQQDPRNTGLVEAMPVEEDDHEQVPDLEEARPVPKEVPRDIPSTRKAIEFCFGGVWVWILLAVVLVTVVLVTASSSTSTDPQDSPTDSNTASTSPASHPVEDTLTADDISPEDHILSLLPQLTQDAINATEIITPQNKAYRWLLDDHHLHTYLDDEQRLLQRFVLATLYYATGGEEYWYNKTNWLSYETHECDWYQTPECFHYCECPDYYNPCEGDNKTYTQISIVKNVSVLLFQTLFRSPSSTSFSPS